MKKSCVVFLFALLLVMPLVVANTETKIKTVPLAEVQMAIFDSDKDVITITERYTGESDEYGDISKTFEIAYDKFGLIIFVNKDDEKLISNEKFLDNPSGEFVYLEAPYKNVELTSTPGFENGVEVEVEEIEEVNETAENETEILEEEGIIISKTGFSVFGEEGVLSKRNFIIFGGFLLLIVIVGFVVASIKYKKHKNPKEIKIKKLSELQKEKKEDLEDKKEDLDDKEKDLEDKKDNIEDYNKIVEDAERKILEAQQDIKKIKNEGKIKEMKKKIAEDEAELIKLREGKD